MDIYYNIQHRSSKLIVTCLRESSKRPDIKLNVSNFTTLNSKPLSFSLVPFRMLVKIKLFFIFVKSTFAIITVDDFPNTEKLNTNLYGNSYVRHQVSYETIPLNGSRILYGTNENEQDSFSNSFLCYDFEKCNVVSTRVSRTKRYIPLMNNE